MPNKSSAKFVLRWLSLVITLGILFFTLWPFNPFPRNRVSWLPASVGIRFNWEGMVRSPLPITRESQPAQPGSSSLEVWIKPSEMQTVYTLLDFYEPGNPFRFRLRQYHDGLIVARDFLDRGGKIKRVKIDLDHGLRAGELNFVTITSGEKGTSLYLDGQLKETYPRFRIAPGDLSGPVLLGTAPVDSEPWTGEIHGLAIYAKELSPREVMTHFQSWMRASPSEAPDLVDCQARYVFNERTGNEIHNQVSGGTNLEIPKRYQVPMKAFLRLPWNEFDWSRTYFEDVLRNILGFVPFGLIVYAYLRWSCPRHNLVLWTILAGGTLSLFIEVVQAYLPQRVSGMTDILTNTFGTALGVFVLRVTPIRRVLENVGWLPLAGRANPLANETAIRAQAVFGSR